MKNILKCFFSFIVLFSFNLLVKADLHDYSGGGSGSSGSLGSGGWSTEYVGLKVSIINSSNVVKDVEIFLNSSGKTTYFSEDNNPKTHQKNEIKWIKKDEVTTYEADFLPSKWLDSNNNAINIYNILANDNYTNLKTLLTHSSLNGSAGSGDYIYIEPMVKIDSYYGTAFEMTNAFLDNSQCSNSSSFCYKYTSAVFGGNKSSKRGVLYTTLYVSSNINGVYVSDESSRDDRNNCLKSNTCGRGIGIFKYDDIYPNGKVKITIYNNLTKMQITNPNSQATYKIYSGSNCKGTVVADSVKTVSSTKIVDLVPGTYSILEVTHPYGYEPSKNKCVKSDINISINNTENANIYYDPTCQTALDESDKTVVSLINLYERFNSRGLLNFSNPSCKNNKDDLCKVEKLKNNNLGCLTAADNLNIIFDEKNLSCYDEIVSSINGSKGFCINQFSLINNLGQNSFSSLAGQFLIRKEQTESIATSKTLRTCYIYNKDLYDSYNNIKNNKVSFGDNNDDGKADELKNYKENITLNSSVEVNEYFRKYVYEKTKDYYLNPVYFEKITGKYSINKTNYTTQTPIYGIIARFKNKNSYIPFSLIYDSKEYSSNECTSTTEEKIIKYDKTTNGKLDLEFRLIDTNKPFNREANSNWCDNGDCSEDNNIIQTYIKQRVNSYGIDGDGLKKEPKYYIKLSPNDIKKIRQYNKENKYDNYQTIKNKEGNYINSFLYDLTNGELNKYKDDNTIEKSYGKLDNRLIIK